MSFNRTAPEGTLVKIEALKLSHNLTATIVRHFYYNFGAVVVRNTSINSSLTILLILPWRLPLKCDRISWKQTSVSCSVRSFPKAQVFI